MLALQPTECHGVQIADLFTDRSSSQFRNVVCQHVESPCRCWLLIPGLPLKSINSQIPHDVGSTPILYHK